MKNEKIKNEKREMQMSIRNNLGYIRSSLGFTKTQFRDELVENYFNVEYSGAFPSIRSLWKLADLLDVTVDEIIGREKFKETSLKKIKKLGLKRCYEYEKDAR